MSIMNNLTRILGPSFAAVVISAWGLQWAFYLNAASFFAVVLAWAFVRTLTRARTRPTRVCGRNRGGPALRPPRPPDRFAAAHDVRGHVRRVPRRTAAGHRDRLLHEGASGFALLTGRDRCSARSSARSSPGEFVTDGRRRVAIAVSLLVIAVDVRGHQHIAALLRHRDRARRVRVRVLRAEHGDPGSVDRVVAGRVPRARHGPLHDGHRGRCAHRRAHRRRDRVAVRPG